MTLDRQEQLSGGTQGPGGNGYGDIFRDAATETKGKFADLIGGSLTDNLVYGAREISSGVDLQLLKGDGMVQAVTMTAGGLSVLMPDATDGLVLGRPRSIFNAGSEAFAVKAFGAGPLYASLAPGQVLQLSLLDAGSAAGSWLVTLLDPETMTQAEAEAGTAMIPRYVTAERLAQAIAALAKGTVLQTVVGADITTDSTSSTTFVASPLSAAITLDDAANKVLVLSSYGVGQSGAGVITTLYRDAVNITDGGGSGNGATYTLLDATFSLYNLAVNAEDAPGSKGPHTYAIYYKSNTAGTVYWNRANGDANRRGQNTIILMEIAA